MPKHLRLIWLLAFAFAISASLAGCATQKLVTDPTFTEKVTALLASQDNQKLVIVGKKYHYIFPTTPDLVETLNSPIKQQISLGSSKFVITSSGQVKGTLSLQFNYDIAGEDIGSNSRSEALKLKFSKDYRVHTKDQLTSAYTKEYILNGELFAPQNFDANSIPEKCRQPCSIEVTEEGSLVGKIIKAPLSPLFKGIDEVSMVGGISLYALGFYRPSQNYEKKLRGTEHQYLKNNLIMPR